jgi:hypothetical protein
VRKARSLVESYHDKTHRTGGTSVQDSSGDCFPRGAPGGGAHSFSIVNSGVSRGRL